ncbi:MAG: alpha/beta hydrolase [Gemmatimonadota bacterium]
MRSLALLAPLALAIITAALWSYRTRDYRPVFSRAAGTLVAVRDSTGVGRASDGKSLTDVTLVSDTGLEVRVRVRARGARDGIRHPAALMIGGFSTGRRAAGVPATIDNLVLASIDYPYDGPHELEGWDWLWHLEDVRQGLLGTPPALLLAAQYLYSREDVDPHRVSMIGVSLGVPFAVATAATDRRLAGAIYLHGGGDIRRLYEHAYGARTPDWLTPILSRLVAWLTAPLEPTRYAGSVAPRPTLQVNAAEDRFIPRASVLALYEATRQPKRLIWLDGGHVATNEEPIVDDLMRVTLQWMAETGLR